MPERLVLDDAQYAVLRSLRDCQRDGRDQGGFTPKRRLLERARDAHGLTPERAMKALSDLHGERLVQLDVAQRVFLAGDVTLHDAGSASAPHSMRDEEGRAHLVLPDA